MNKIIKASAGTGKTYTLSLEYIKLLLTGSTPKDLLVTTFTKKATVEIKARILQNLFLITKRNSYILKTLSEQGINVDFKKASAIYKNLLFNKDKLRIYTIDSFINSIFNKYVVPYFNLYGYAMIDKDENELIFEEILENLIQSEGKFNELEKFFSAFIEKDVTNYVKWIAEFINSRWKFLLQDKKIKSNLPCRDVLDSFDAVLESLKNLIQVKEPKYNLKEFLKTEFKEIVTIKNKLSYFEKNFSLFLNNNNFWNGIKLRRSKKNVIEYDNLIETYEAFKKDLASHIFNQKLIPLESEIFKLSEIIFKEYDRLKFKYKKFVYNDVLVYTYKFVTEFSGHTQEILDNLVDYAKTSILVDEFQDTSILQWSIIKIFAKAAKQLIAVGDEKQSIYKWRGGEKRLFQNLDKLFDSQVSSLDTSYRSQRAIVQFINRFFKSLGMLESDVRYLKHNNRGYLEIAFDHKKDSKERVVEMILNRGLKFKNVAILARTNAELEELGVYLTEREIPYIKESSLSILDHKAVKPIYSLVKFLTKYEFFDLVSFLRSEAINISSEQLKQILRNRDRVMLYLTDESSLDQEEIVLKILDKIKKVINSKDSVREIIAEFGFIERFDTINDIKNITKFYELSNKHNNLSEFVDYLNNNKASEILKQEGAKDVNAINLMTVHKAKGLEFETVIVLWHFSTRSVAKKEKLSLYLEFNDLFSELVDSCFTSSDLISVLQYCGKDYEATNKEQELEEELNNFYVATTRAKANLLMVVSFDKSTKSIETIEPENDIFIEKIKNAFLASINIKNVNLLFRDSYVVGELYQKESNTHIENNLLEFNLEPFVELKSKPLEPISLKIFKKMRKGDILHYFLSLINTKQDLANAIVKTKIKFSNFINKEILDKIIRKGEEFVNSSSIFDKVGHNEIVLFHEGKEYRIDRLIIDDHLKKIEIIDYKTGLYNDEQIENYVNILKKKYPAYKIQGKIVSVKV